jgi:indolepyruvate ferredoxin oxidoreductase
MNAPATLKEFTLEDKYTLVQGRAFMTGLQALVRLPMLQRERDLAAGLNTAGFISGYRGSPLGAYDQTLWKAKDHLEAHHIRFQPGLNEDLAATAVWGTQQVNLFPGAQYDGVFAMWYGKGPGVDRSGDVLKHGNSAGTSRHGGVLVLTGDDHGARSSTVAHQSEHMLKAAMIPVLHPASVQEYLDLGLHGFAMSRFSGCWVGFKCVTDVVESGATVDIHPERVNIVLPADFGMPPGGLNIRLPDAVLEQEARLLDFKVYAALAYARANRLDRVIWDGGSDARFGIITTGKSYGDTMQALADLGLDERAAREAGIRLYKVSMPWPLEPQGARAFAAGLEEILVVEEKRQLIEYQLKEELYEWRDSREGGLRPPRVVGKFDDNGEWSIAAGKPAGNWLLPAHFELSPALIARAIVERLDKAGVLTRLGEERTARARSHIEFLDRKEKALARPRLTVQRPPFFCSGCPHNTSTRLPEGSLGMAGIGCHYMVQWMDRNTPTFTQMGGEGVPWIGQAPFTDTQHMFANLGDGTYFHSGLLAIRAAVSAKVNITYKILYNDAVAMTGGQHVDGPLDPATISRQIADEGVSPIVVVTDEPHKYPTGTAWAPGVTIRHRDELDAVQRELREVKGVSAMIYDQTCAAEKRRRRKRGAYPDPAKRVFINDLVCEGCGDCSVQSNCLSVEPLETEFGRKRTINQSSCNKDYSCVKGFCPSFVTVEGGRLKKAATVDHPDNWPELPQPTPVPLARPFECLVTGIGGTGVITIGQIIAAAAHAEGKGASVLDMSGLAQKGGAVTSHVRVAASPDDLHAVRVGMGAADLVLGCDLVVTAGNDALSRMDVQRTHVALNSSVSPTAEFVRNPDWRLPGSDLRLDIAAAAGAGHVDFVPATGLATALMGDAIASNMFLLGYAFQKGWIPLAAESFDRAIELNGVSVQANRQAFLWGRRAACDLARVNKAAHPAQVIPLNSGTEPKLDDIIERRAAFLVQYQNLAYARRYRELVKRVHATETGVAGEDAELRFTAAVARNYFKLLAIKDEFEVARLHTRPEFLQPIRDRFEGDYKLKFHLAPPTLAKPDPKTGRIQKKEYGSWMLAAFHVLARLRFLRGTALDPFRNSEDRKLERRLLLEYEAVVAELIERLDSHNLGLAEQIAAIPEDIRGYGHIRAQSARSAKQKEDELLAQLRAPSTPRERAA